jgi:hypothetical protein
MNIGAFFSGGIDPYWPHCILIGVTLLGSAAVTWGLIRESERFWTLTNLLIVGGVIIEAICTILLFGFDEGISNAQQSKIIGLETRIAPRVLTEDQYAAIQALRGKVDTVFVLSSPDSEPATFSAQLQQALVDAGVNVKPVPATAGSRFVGTSICSPDKEDAHKSPLWIAFSAIGLQPNICKPEDFGLPSLPPNGAPLVVIGERPPFFPNGAPKSLRFRIYPEFGKPAAGHP